MGIGPDAEMSIGRATTLVAFLSLLMALAAPGARGQAAASNADAPKAAPAVGTIKSISGNALKLTTDAGAEVNVILPAEIKVLRVPPGSKDLKDATPMQLKELQVGDRILVRGKAGQEADSVLATTVVAMKKADIAEKQAHEREQWQRNGIGGLVKSVDAGTGVIKIGTMTGAGNKEVQVHAAQSTILRRYVPNSVKFDDAKVSPIAEIKEGDQLRARGTRSADGGEFAADEIVSGTFRNIAGTVLAVDAIAGTLRVDDLTTKKQLQVKVTPESQLRKLPQPMAQRIAMRLKGNTGEANGTAGGGPTAPAAGAPGAGQGGSGASTGGPSGPARSGSGDIQQMLSRLPASPLSEFQKGDAVMIVASSGQSDAEPTVITLLGGVEPILQASPQGQAASILTPWSLSSGGGDAGTP